MKKRDESGALYGKEGSFYDNLPKHFKNYIWIELIGFDKNKIDFGLGEFIKKVGFKPKGIILLVTSIDIINKHINLKEEQKLDPYFCSYVGHLYNDEREIQEWTNFDLKKFVAEINKLNIESYVSFFDYLSPSNSICDKNLSTVSEIDGKLEKNPFIYMTKRFENGTFYEDFFLKKAKQFLTDYGFSGIHLADGIIRPRLPLQWADVSDDMLSQAGIKVPKNMSRVEYISKNKRKEWLSFCEKRWMSYLKKIVNGINKEGFKVLANSTWTKGPMESLYRYGISYKDVDTLPLESYIVENGSPTLSILDNEANAGYVQSYEDRKMLNHYFRASLLLISACMKNTSLTPLFPVRDTAEQYDVIHHLPTALPRHTADLFSTFIWKSDGTLTSYTDGHTFCLSDGLTSDDWKFLRLCSDNAYTNNFKEVLGATVIWSDKRNRSEIDALIKKRFPSTEYILSKLLRKGAWVFKSAHIDDLSVVSGDILVVNPNLMSNEELKKIKGYKKGRVIYISGSGADGNFSTELNPKGIGFPYPLYYNALDEKELDLCVEKINENLSYLLTYKDECQIQEIKISDKKSKFFIRNEEYYYTRPVIETKRKIKSVTDITKLQGYVVSYSDTTFQTLVPLRGIAILEVDFE